MDAEDMLEAKRVVLSSPTRPRYRDDREIVVRRSDVPIGKRQLVGDLALELGVVMRPAFVSELRESESTPLLGDTEYRFPVDLLD